MQMTRNRKVSTLSYSVKTDKFIRIRIFTNKLMISQCKRCGGRIKKKTSEISETDTMIESQLGAATHLRTREGGNNLRENRY